ncbi:MAG: ice-binding family protein, partial [Pyrinomonadaceae bacterium]
MKKNIRRPFLQSISGRAFYLTTLLILTAIAAVGYLAVFSGSSTVSAARDEAEVATPEMINFAMDFKGDMATSLSAINQLPCTELKDSALGGKTLTPGVYCLASADLAGDLRLDGLNDASSVFIFRIAGSLNAKAGSSVVLENLAQAGSVFFVANDKATIGTGSNFNGRILAENDIVVESGAFVGGKIASAKGRVSASPEANLGGTATGVLQICKVVDHDERAPDIRNRIFHFTVTGVAEEIRVAHGQCSSQINVPVGPATITELPTGTFTDRAGSWSGNFQVIQVRRLSELGEDPQSTLGTINLPRRTAAINIVEGGPSRQLIVEYTNKYAITGYVEICKYAASGPGRFNPNGDPEVVGYFEFIVENVFSQPNSTVLQKFIAPVGQCTGPIAVTISTPIPTGTPKTTEVSVAELPRPGFFLESTTVVPQHRKLGPPVLLNGGGVQDVVLEEGGASTETRVNFFNRSNPGIVKICKIAGPGVPLNTLFRFRVSGPYGATLLVQPQENVYAPVGPILVDVAAGRPEDGGNCQIVPGIGAGVRFNEFQTFVNGTPVSIVEHGISPDNTIPQPRGAQLRTSRIRSTTGFSSGFAPNPDLTPIDCENADMLIPDCYVSRATVPARVGVTEVEFVNFYFRPTELKVCKIAGAGLTPGGTFTFDLELVNPVDLNNVPLFPDWDATINVTSGPELNGGFCVVVDGSDLQGGAFNQGSKIRVTERTTTPATTVQSITSNAPLAADPANRTAVVGGLVGGSGGGSGMNIVTFTNIPAAGGPGTLAYRAPSDFDGDNKSDLSIYRSSTGSWWWAATSQGGTHNSVNWGMPTDK